MASLSDINPTLIIYSMSISTKNVEYGTQKSFNSYKLHIEDVEISGEVNSFEIDIKAFLSRYGTILESKIVKNSKITRARQARRVHYV